MSLLGDSRQNDDVVLVFRPPENPAAQMAGVTPFKSLRLRLDELLDWFKDLNVDSIDLWIEGAFKSGNHTELFLSVEGRTGAKITLRPFLKHVQTVISPAKVENLPDTGNTSPPSKEGEASGVKMEKIVPKQSAPQITALFSPGGGIERHLVSLIDSSVGVIEMAATEFTNMYIEKALLEAIKRGVKVAIIFDRRQTVGRQANFHDTLEKAGSDIRLISPREGVMHDKYIIVDGKTVAWGSYNYTEPAENKNFENAAFASDSAIAQQYHTDFASIFNQAKPEARGLKRIFLRFLRRFA